MIFAILNKELAKSTNIGVVTMDKNQEGKDYLHLHGFAGISDSSHIVLRDDGDILTMEIDPNCPLERCVVLNKENLSHHILVDYFEEFDAIGVLFVRVGNTYIQCKGVKVKV